MQCRGTGTGIMIRTPKTSTQSEKRAGPIVAELEKKLQETDVELRNKIRLQQEQVVKCYALVSDLTKRLEKIEEKQASVKVCPRDFIELFGSCYYYSTVQKTWHQAQEHCQSISANLVTITSKDENEIIWKHLPGSVKHWWIGASDRISEGTWVWVANNSRLTYTNWNKGEPNNQGGSENCAELNKERGSPTWNDVPCSGTRQFVCEWSRL
ncbi:perlucin-like [Lingula anatina]|uniref:Perlucin-like n=1 Tax=Lingula anatina TaxID=7574 RepID=A0A2R2MIM6_LINAN|nr:perlucin-like [Lingula anatina]|eukprot:XP_023930080.1 perlucin-like [Lingula anatina]